MLGPESHVRIDTSQPAIERNMRKISTPPRVDMFNLQLYDDPPEEKREREKHVWYHNHTPQHRLDGVVLPIAPPRASWRRTTVYRMCENKRTSYRMSCYDPPAACLGVCHRAAYCHSNLVEMLSLGIRSVPPLPEYHPQVTRFSVKITPSENGTRAGLITESAPAYVVGFIAAN